MRVVREITSAAAQAFNPRSWAVVVDQKDLVTLIEVTCIVVGVGSV